MGIFFFALGVILVSFIIELRFRSNAATAKERLKRFWHMLSSHGNAPTPELKASLASLKSLAFAFVCLALFALWEGLLATVFVRSYAIWITAAGVLVLAGALSFRLKRRLKNEESPIYREEILLFAVSILLLFQARLAWLMLLWLVLRARILPSRLMSK